MVAVWCGEKAVSEEKTYDDVDLAERVQCQLEQRDLIVPARDVALFTHGVPAMFSVRNGSDNWVSCTYPPCCTMVSTTSCAAPTLMSPMTTRALRGGENSFRRLRSTLTHAGRTSGQLPSRRHCPHLPSFRVNVKHGADGVAGAHR